MTEEPLSEIAPPAARYPGWLRGAIIVFAVAHDVAMLVAARAAANFTPPSVQQALVPDWLFVGMLAFGALAGIAGTAMRKTVVELVGVALMAFGMFTWAVSAFTQMNQTPSTATVATAFLAGGLALGWRFLGLLVGVFLRVRD